MSRQNSRVGSYETFSSSIVRGDAALPAELPLSQPTVATRASSRPPRTTDAIWFDMASLTFFPVQVRRSRIGTGASGGAGFSVRWGRDRFTPRRQHEDPRLRLPAYTDNNSRGPAFAAGSTWTSWRKVIRPLEGPC